MIYWVFTIPNYCFMLFEYADFFSPKNSHFSISLMKKLSCTVEKTCTTGYWKLSWQVVGLDFKVDLMPNPLISANTLSCLSWEIDAIRKEEL